MPIQIIETNLKFTEPLIKRTETDFLILHHSASPDTLTVEQIHQEHLAKGWAGIGYNFVIDPAGKIFTGRPVWAIGAHCPNFNHNSIGICSIGNFEIKPQMPKPQHDSLVELIQYLKAEPVYSHVITVGHRDKYATACPGLNFPLPEFKAMFNK